MKRPPSRWSVALLEATKRNGRGGHAVPRCVEKTHPIAVQSFGSICTNYNTEKIHYKNPGIHMNPSLGLESNMFECDSITVQQKMTQFDIALEFKRNAALIQPKHSLLPLNDFKAFYLHF